MKNNRKRKTTKLHSAAKAGRNDKKPLLVALCAIILCALVTGCYVAYRELHKLWIEQCEIIDVTKQVTVVGGQYTNDGIVMELLGLKKGANLATINFAEKRERVLERIPGIKSLTIQRKLPDKVEITIEEREPVARMKEKGNKRITGRVVDSEGVVFLRQPNTSTLPFICEDKARITKQGQKLTGRQLAALRLAEISQDDRFKSLGVLSIDTTPQDFLIAILGNYATVKIAWEGMDAPTFKTAGALEKQFSNLYSAVKSNVARNRSGGVSAVVWNATQPGYIYADTKEPIQ